MHLLIRVSKRHAVEQERVERALSPMELVEAEAISRCSVKLSPQPYAVVSLYRYICPDSSDVVSLFSQAATVVRVINSIVQLPAGSQSDPAHAAASATCSRSCSDFSSVKLGCWVAGVR